MEFAQDGSIVFNNRIAQEIGVSGMYDVFMFDGFAYQVTDVVGDYYTATPVDSDEGMDDSRIGYFY